MAKGDHDAAWDDLGDTIPPVMNWATVLTVSVAVFLAFAGYLATYLNGVRLAQRRDRLDRVNRQLSEFYGPLFALVRASGTSYRAFRVVVGRPRGAFWRDDPPPTPEQAATYRLWMREVFAPLNTQMADLVIEKADLLIEDRMPDCLLDLCAHVAAYKAVLRQWDERDLSAHSSVINFPGEQLAAYTEASFLRLKEDQARLIRAVGGRVEQDASRAR